MSPHLSEMPHSLLDPQCQVHRQPLLSSCRILFHSTREALPGSLSNKLYLESTGAGSGQALSLRTVAAGLPGTWAGGLGQRQPGGQTRGCAGDDASPVSPALPPAQARRTGTQNE